jgi:hypothetical protein
MDGRARGYSITSASDLLSCGGRGGAQASANAQLAAGAIYGMIDPLMFKQIRRRKNTKQGQTSLRAQRRNCHRSSPPEGHVEQSNESPV